MTLKKRTVLIHLCIAVTTATCILGYLSFKQAPSFDGKSSAKANREADREHAGVPVNDRYIASGEVKNVERHSNDTQKNLVMTVFAKEAGELFDIYLKGISENSSMDQKFTALLVAGLCGEAIAKPMEYGNPEVPDKRPSFEAQAHLKDRCKGFFQYDSIVFSKSASTLSKLVNSDQSKYSDALYALPPSPTAEQINSSRKNIKHALETDGIAALSWVSSGLANYLTTRARQANGNQVDPSFKSAETLDAAISIAQCNLGFACGSDSLHYYAICSSTGSCSGNIVDSVYGILANEEKRIIARKQSQIIESAILGGDFAALGLSD